MMNELILLIHISFIALSTIVAYRLGKNTLVTFVALTMVVANLFVLKQITLLGLSVTAADALAIGSMLGLNMLQEFFGAQSAKDAIVTTFFSSAFFVIASMIHLWYLPSSYDSMHEHFVPLLSPAPSLVAASIAIYTLSQLIDFMIYAILKKTFRDRFLVLRNYIAIGVSQLIDTTMFTFCLSAMGLIEKPLHVMIISFGIKLVITLIATPIITFARTGKTS